MIYFVIFGILAFLAFAAMDKKYTAYIKLSSFAALFVLAIFSGLRSSEAGSDYLSYHDMFYAFKDLFNGGLAQVFSGDYFFEPGFALLIIIISSFTDNHIVFFLAISLLASLVMAISINKLSLYPLLSILIFFSYDYFINYMVAIRFGLAAGLGLVVICLLSKNKKKLALVFILFAMSMHTAAIGFFLPFVLSIFTFKRIYIVAVLAVALIVGYVDLGNVLISMLPGWIPRAGSAEVYASSSMYGNSLGYLGFINIKYIFLSTILFLYWNNLKDRVPHFYPLAMFLVSAMAIRVGFHDLGFIVGRVSALLGLVEIIIVPAFVLLLIKQKIMAFFIVVIYAFFHLYFL